MVQPERAYREARPLDGVAGARLAAVARRPPQHRGALIGALLLSIGVSLAASYGVAARGRERIRKANEIYTRIVRQTDDIEAKLAHGDPELAVQMWFRLRDSVQGLQRGDPSNPGLRLIAADAYMTLGRFASFRYSNSLVDPDAALESYRRAVDLFDPAQTQSALYRSSTPRIYATDVMIEKGRAFESFREVARVLPAIELMRRIDPPASQWPQLADFGSYYDMISDRLGANMQWLPAAHQSRDWYGELAALHPYRATDTIALHLYEQSMAKAGEAAGTVLIRFQLGRLQHQTGKKEEGIRTLRQTLQAMLTTGEGATPDRIARTYSRIAQALEQDGDLAEAVRYLDKAVETIGEPQNPYLREVLGEALVSRGRVLARSARPSDALASAKRGIQLLSDNAIRGAAPALALDLAAQRLLTVEPAQLRDPDRALRFAQQAVEQTAGEMAPYLVTLAVAESAAGRETEARLTAARALDA